MARSRLRRGDQFPLPYTVKRIRRTPVLEQDKLGNDVWVDKESPDDVAVAGWSVPTSDEPKLAGHDRRTVTIELLAPVGTFHTKDAVKLPGRDDALEVIGEAENASHNPFGWDPGLEVINLGGIT